MALTSSFETQELRYGHFSHACRAAKGGYALWGISKERFPVHNASKPTNKTKQKMRTRGLHALAGGKCYEQNEQSKVVSD